MKFLILTASTGGGHNQAANNLKKEIEDSGNIAKVVDIFNYKNDAIKNKIVTKGYDIMATKLPDIYKVFYKFSNNKYFWEIVPKSVFFAQEKNIKNIIEEYEPEVVISVHPFAVSMVSQIKNKTNHKFFFIQIVTDFMAHYSYINDLVDAYIVGSDYTKKTLIDKNIKEEKIFVLGIPTRKEFQSKSELDDNEFRVMIMGGSMGVKKLEKCVEVLLASDLDIKISTICGSNYKLQQKLCKKFVNEIVSGRLDVYGFTNDISKIMDKSKLLITKPGGLTSTEAINKHIPMLIPFSLPGQEVENTQFLVDSNMAIAIRDINDLPFFIENLINDKKRYKSMIDSMKSLSSRYSIEAIIKLYKE